ncbi:hypothetical protein AAG906_038858 [Vitis piasezkii]
MQSRPPHSRAITPPSPIAYTRGCEQFTPLGMTLTRALRSSKTPGLIVPLVPCLCHILFLLTSSYMSIAYIIIFGT